MAQFQKDGLWVQGGKGQLVNVNEQTPFVLGQLGRVMSICASSGLSTQTDTKIPRFYQYVQNTSTTQTNAISTGLNMFWDDIDEYIVGPDTSYAVGGTTNALFAGLAINTYPQAGYYGFIQVGGPASAYATGTVNIGDVLIPSDKYLAAQSAIDTPLVNVPSVAIALSAIETATGSALDVYLCPAFKNGW